MSNKNLFKDEHLNMIEEYKKKTIEFYLSQFRVHKNRFRYGDILISKFRKITEDVVQSRKPEDFDNLVYPLHNELCIANALLAQPQPKINFLEYEPDLHHCEKSIDFRGTFENGYVVFVDVKTIMPIIQDDWEKYIHATRNDFLPSNKLIGLSQDGLGGEIWHNWITCRSRMLEHTVGLEHKIAEAKLDTEETEIYLALCGNGGSWSIDELEDFVQYYYRGYFYGCDDFSLMQAHQMKKEKIAFKKTISGFSYLERRKSQLRPGHLRWCVIPPSEPGL